MEKLHVNSILKTEQSSDWGRRDSVKREGRSFQEEKSRNKWVEITGMLVNQQQPGDLKSRACGRGWLTGNVCWDQKLEPSRPELSLNSVAREKSLTSFK